MDGNCVNVEPLQFPTDPLNEGIAAAVQSSSKEMAQTVPTHYVELQRIAFLACNQARTTGHPQGHTGFGIKARALYFKRLISSFFCKVDVRVLFMFCIKITMSRKSLIL